MADEKQGAMRDWLGIEEFVVVAETGSVSGAADLLGLSKSQVSKRLTHLETRLGVRLLHRTTRSVTLTPMGGDFVERCRRILENFDDAEMVLKDKQANPVGNIRLTAAGAFAEHYLVPLVAEFMVAHPGVEVDIDITNRRVDMLEEHYDLAIRSGSLPDKSSYIVKRLTGYRLSTCATPAYLETAEARGLRLSEPEDLVDHDCLVGTLPFWRFAYQRSGDQSAGLKELRVTGRWRSNSGYALVRAVKAGLGIVQLPEFYLRDELAGGELISVLEDHRADDVPVWAIYVDRQYMPTKVRLLMNFLSSRLPARL